MTRFPVQQYIIIQQQSHQIMETIGITILYYGENQDEVRALTSKSIY